MIALFFNEVRQVAFSPVPMVDKEKHTACRLRQYFVLPSDQTHFFDLGRACSTEQSQPELTQYDREPGSDGMMPQHSPPSSSTTPRNPNSSPVELNIWWTSSCHQRKINDPCSGFEVVCCSKVIVKISIGIYLELYVRFPRPWKPTCRGLFTRGLRVRTRNLEERIQSTVQSSASRVFHNSPSHKPEIKWDLPFEIPFN